VFDVTLAVESGFESGKWQAPDYTTDGIHETLTANLAIKAAYEDAIVGAIGDSGRWREPLPGRSGREGASESLARPAPSGPQFGQEARRGDVRA
jgi:hypothetical protein